jgi:hypothetical protein
MFQATSIHFIIQITKTSVSSKPQYPRYKYVKPLKPNGNYMSHLLQQSVNLHLVFVGFV